jgi:hypothetical protein
MKVTEMTFSTSHGDVLVTAKQFASISDDDLEFLEITRDELVRCWKEGEELMKDHMPGDRVRPIAEVNNDGARFVEIVGYSEHTDVKKPKRSEQQRTEDE